ncbi:hypothetical protein DENIT_90329 [Pseudomonas veronii]|nr:hypothetical protein DENIT_90329 [Pseudomonas veronii]
MAVARAAANTVGSSRREAQPIAFADSFWMVFSPASLDIEARLMIGFASKTILRGR